MSDVRPAGSGPLASLADLADRLAACPDLDQVLTAGLDSLASDFGFEHSLVLLLDETGTTLFTIASRGYDRAGIGSEVGLGEGLIGSVASDGAPRRIGNLQRMLSYARSARGDEEGSPLDIPLPGLEDANSQLAVPMTVSGRTLGVLGIESARLGAFTLDDEHLLRVVAHLVAGAIELDRIGQGADASTRESAGSPAPEADAVGRTEVTVSAAAEPAVVRFYAVDGSTFVDGDYLIKGVPGRILNRLLRDHLASGRTEFTNREVRLDPSLELPSFRDNLESRLILLKRRLDEREAPVRIEKTGRGQFRLLVRRPVHLDLPDDATPASAASGGTT